MMTALATAELKTIRVYGDLAKLLKQRTFKAAVRSPQDAIKFLLANFPEVESYILPRFFHIRVGEREISEDDLEAPTGVFEEIRIIPAICGAGGGVGQIITGVTLIAGSFLVPFAAPVLLPLGIGLTLTGIATFLTPTPSDRPESTDPSDSYNFNGLQQTSREGIPVPVVYGEIFTGSVVLSVKVEEDDEELEADFAAGTGDPNPDPNPVPDPDPDIDPADYQGGWRWYIFISSTLQRGTGPSYQPGSGPFIVQRGADSNGVLQYIPYLEYELTGYTPTGSANWVANFTRYRDPSQSGLATIPIKAASEVIVGTPSNQVGDILYAHEFYNTDTQNNTTFTVSGYFKLYTTKNDYDNDTNATIWSGNTI